MFGQAVVDGNAPPGDSGSDHKGPCLNPVGDYFMSAGPQVIDPLDDDGVGPVPFNIRTHGPEHVCQVLNLRLIGRILEDCPAFGGNCGCHDVFSSRNRRDIKENFCTVQPVCPGIDIAVIQKDVGPHGHEGLQMQIDGTGPNGAASRQRDLGPAASGQERPQ